MIHQHHNFEAKRGLAYNEAQTNSSAIKWPANGYGECGQATGQCA